MDDQNDHRKHADDQQRDPQVADGALGADVARTHRDHVGHAGQDTCKQDDGDTVADTELIDLLAQPHHERRTGNKRNDDHERRPDALLLEDVVVLADHVVAKALKQGDRHGRVAGDGGDLLLAGLAAVAGETLERGDRDRQQLDDDRAVDVGLDAQREDRRFCERAAGHDVVEAKHGAAHAVEIVAEQRRVDIGDGDRVTDAED